VPVYVSLLRAVNVGGRKVPMAELRVLYEQLGHDDVVTYLQSGNVISRSGVRSAPAVERAASEAITDAFGFDVDVQVRTPKQLRSVLGDNPFLADRSRHPDRTSLHVTFLAAAPDPARARGLDATGFAPDDFRIAGREVYLCCPNGYGRTKLTTAWFERKLDVSATTRNWTTVAKLVELTDT
jgi:uncharacterized protein (DUF1697 family)